jgi:hypothetical protein
LAADNSRSRDPDSLLPGHTGPTLEGVKCTFMNFNDSWLPNIIVTLSRDVLAFLGARWLLPRLPAIHRFVVIQVARLRRRRPQNVTVTPGTSGIAFGGSAPVLAVRVPDPMPPGTASAIAMAIDSPPVPPTRLPQLVPGYWAHLDAIHGEPCSAVHAARLHAANPALFDNPYNYALYRGIPPWSAESAAGMHGRSLQ